MICAAFLLSLVISCANSCICITTTTTTASATTTAATTVATTTTTTVAAGRRKRSADGKVNNIDEHEFIAILSECAELQALEQMAFQVCPHGSDGFTWEEVMDCEVTIFLEKNMFNDHYFCRWRDQQLVL